ncbi:MAG: hypothetical protein Q8932_02160 [Bacteroidota bacterium]|nr:hypothetical protein [Bacteroidota bacterium]MDP4255936.1 hypothetical protein [Bacteroidota bacterium]MDP4258676.1 hypothetical protein [Bacteroidota bacterium]
MNTQIKAVISKLIFVTLLSVAVIAAQAQVQAQVQSPAPVAGEKGSPAQVKYIGTQEDLFVFSVAYQNPQGTPFGIVVKDQDGSQLYQSTFRDKDFNKQFRVPRGDKDSKVVFIFRNDKGNEFERSFEIKVSSRYVDEIAVKKL